MGFYPLVPLISFIINVYILIRVYSLRHETSVTNAFMALTGIIAAWSFNAFICQGPALTGHELIIFRISAILWIMSGFFFLNMVYAILGKRRDWFWLLTATLSGTMAVYAFFTDMVVSRAMKVSWGWKPDAGSLFYLAIGVVAFNVLAAFSFVFSRSRRDSDADRQKLFKLVMIAGIIPLSTAILFDVILFHIFNMIDTPIISHLAVTMGLIVDYVALHDGGFLISDISDLTRTLFANIGDGVMLVSANGEILKLNNTASEMLKIGDSNEPGRLSRYFPDFEPGQECHQHDTVITHSGEDRHFSVSQSLVGLDGEKCTVVIMRDITKRKELEHSLTESRDNLERSVRERTLDLQTANRKLIDEIEERKRTDEALRESEERFRLLTYNSADMIWKMGLDRNFTYVSPSSYRLFGYTPKEVIELPLNKFVTQESYDLAASNFRREVELAARGMVDSDRSVCIRLLHICKDGRKKWGEVNMVFLRDETGRVTGIQGMTRDITERVRAEESIKENEERFRQLVDLLPTGVFEVDDMAKLTFLSSRASEMCSLTAADVKTGKVSATDLVDTVEREKFEAFIDDVLHEKGNRSVETMVYSADGHSFPIRIYASAIEKGDIVVGARGVIIDITEEKDNEQALRDYSSLQSVIAAIRGVPYEASEFELWNSFLSMIVNRYGLYMGWYGAYRNGQIRPMHTAGKVDKYLDQLVLDVREPESPDAQCAMSKAIFSGEPFGYGDMANEEGFRAWRDYAIELGYASNIAIPFGVYGEIEGGVMFYSTQEHAFTQRLTSHLERAVKEMSNLIEERRLRKRAEAALSQSEERLRAIFQNAKDSIFMKDRELRYIQVNEAMERIFDISSTEIIGSTDEILFDTTIMESIIDEDRRALSGEVVEVEREIIIRNESRYFDSIKMPIKDETGVIIGLCGIARDVTERKKNEAERNELESKLRQSEKMEAIGMLAGGVAHDFNNQLSVIMGFADLMKEILDDEEMRGYADKIVNVSRRASDLNRQLLEFARKGDHRFISVDMHNVIREVASLIEHTRDKRIVISTSLKATQSMVNGDLSQLQNALLNISINACDSMPDGGELSFETETETLSEDRAKLIGGKLTAGEYLTVKISDTGAGMDDATLNHIFEPFFTTKEKGRGTGMGLAAVYGIVNNHNGAVVAASIEEIGSTFMVYLPLLNKDEINAVEQDIFMPAKNKNNNLLVLVCEDEEDVAGMTTNMLNRLGYRTALCRNGAEAVEYFREHWNNIGAIVLDIVMPVMNGRDAFMEMKKIDPDLHVVVASGFSLEGDAQSIIDAGAKAFIQKPFLMSELAKVLDMAIGEPTVGQKG